MRHANLDDEPRAFRPRHDVARRSRGLRRSAAALVLAGSLLAACGSDGASSSPSATEGTLEADDEATYEIVSAAEVATGLAATRETMTTLTASPATADKTAIDALFSAWFTYEGTIKQNDVATYLDIEDALGAFKKAAGSSDAAAMATATADFDTAATSYLASFPG